MKKVELVTPWQCTDEEAKAAILTFFEQHPGADPCDAAEFLHLPVLRVCEITDVLAAEGKLAEWSEYKPAPDGTVTLEEAATSLKEWVQTKDQRHKELVNEEYEFWQRIDAMAEDRGMSGISTKTEKLISLCHQSDGGMQINISRSGVSVSIAGGRGKGETIDEAMENAALNAISHYENYVKQSGEDNDTSQEMIKRAKKLREILESLT